MNNYLSTSFHFVTSGYLTDWGGGGGYIIGKGDGEKGWEVRKSKQIPKYKEQTRRVGLHTILIPMTFENQKAKGKACTYMLSFKKLFLFGCSSAFTFGSESKQQMLWVPHITSVNSVFDRCQYCCKALSCFHLNMSALSSI